MLMTCATFNVWCRSVSKTCLSQKGHMRHKDSEKKTRKSNVKPKPISVKGYKGFIDLQKGIIYLNLGDIAGVYNEIDIPAIAEAAFKKYPQCKVCRMKFEVVAFNRQDEYKAVFRKTPQGVVRE